MMHQRQQPFAHIPSDYARVAAISSTAHVYVLASIICTAEITHDHDHYAWRHSNKMDAIVQSSCRKLLVHMSMSCPMVCVVRERAAMIDGNPPSPAPMMPLHPFIRCRIACKCNFFTCVQDTMNTTYAVHACIRL